MRPQLDRCCREIRRKATLYQSEGSRRQRPEAHIKDKSSSRPDPGERGPVDLRLRLCRVLVTGHERHRRRDPSMSDRDTGVRQCGDTSRNSWHNLKANARRRQRLRLLTPSPKNEWIAALEAYDALATSREADEETIDLVLPCGLGRPAALPDVMPLWSGRDKERIGEGIEDDGIASFQQLAAPNGDQTRITGTGADEIHDAARRGRRAHDRRAPPSTPANARHDRPNHDPLTPPPPTPPVTHAA